MIAQNNSGQVRVQALLHSGLLSKREGESGCPALDQVCILSYHFHMGMLPVGPESPFDSQCCKQFPFIAYISNELNDNYSKC